MSEDYYNLQMIMRVRFVRDSHFQQKVPPNLGSFAKLGSTALTYSVVPQPQPTDDLLTTQHKTCTSATAYSDHTPPPARLLIFVMCISRTMPGARFSRRTYARPVRAVSNLTATCISPGTKAHRTGQVEQQSGQATRVVQDHADAPMKLAGHSAQFEADGSRP